MKQLQLEREFDMYTYLNQSGTMKMDNMNDEEAFQVLATAFDSLQFKPEEIMDVYRIVSSVLNLGNIDLVDNPDTDGSEVENEGQVHVCASVMGVKADELKRAITHRSVTILNETSYIPLPVDKAIDARDALAKEMYKRMFDYLVRTINARLAHGESNQTIGLLDIFGFEIFRDNYFEQLNINYANEKLQQHFNHHIFKMEQDVNI